MMLTFLFLVPAQALKQRLSPSMGNKASFKPSLASLMATEDDNSEAPANADGGASPAKRMLRRTTSSFKTGADKVVTGTKELIQAVRLPCFGKPLPRLLRVNALKH